MVRQLSIDQFENESRRVSMGTDSISKALPSPMFERNSNEPCVSKVSLRCLFCRTVALRTIKLVTNNACVAFSGSHDHRITQKHNSSSSANCSTRGLGSLPRTVPSCSRQSRSTSCATPQSRFSERNRACCSCRVSLSFFCGDGVKVRSRAVRCLLAPSPQLFKVITMRCTRFRRMCRAPHASSTLKLISPQSRKSNHSKRRSPRVLQPPSRSSGTCTASLGT